MGDPILRRNRREAGVAMFVTVLILVIMGWLGLAALDSATRDQQVAGFQNRSRSAFYAADAGVTAARALVDQQEVRTATPALPQTFLGDPAMYARWGQQPSYSGDPATLPKPPIYWLTDAGCLGGSNCAKGSYTASLWQINVVGQSYNPAGGIGSQRASTVRLQAVVVKPMWTSKNGY